MSKKIDNSKWVPAEKLETVEHGLIFREPPRGYDYRSQFGKSSMTIDCAFCNTPHDVYLWSLSGSGRRCDNCNAKMSAFRHYAEIDRLMQPYITAEQNTDNENKG